MKNIKDTQELKFMNIGDKQIAFAEINGARWFVTRDVAAYICASATALNLHIRHSFPNITTATRFDKCGKNGVRVFKERYLVKQAFLEYALADIHFGNKKLIGELLARLSELDDNQSTILDGTESLLNNPDFIINAMQKLKEAKAQKEHLSKMVKSQQERLDLIKQEQQALRDVVGLKENEIKNRDKIIDSQKQEINTMQPKATYFDEILSCQGAIPITVIAKDYGWSGRRMNDYLFFKKVQYKCGGVWVLYQKYTGMGYTSSETKNIDGQAVIITKWTQKGRMFIYELMKADGYLPIIEQKAKKPIPKKAA